MRKYIFLLIALVTTTAYSEGSDIIYEPISPVEVSKIYDKNIHIGLDGLIDLIDKEEKIEICVTDYVRKQSKSYTKIAQNNLYDLIHNFSSVTSKIYGKKPPVDDIPYEDKIEALARVQCEVYYTTGVIK